VVAAHNMEIHHLNTDESIASLHSKREGLNAPEAARRLQEKSEIRIQLRLLENLKK
jgi:hypothetical protein